MKKLVFLIFPLITIYFIFINSSVYAQTNDPGTFTCGYDPYVGSGSCEVADPQCNAGFQPDMSLCSKNKDSSTCNSAGRINCVANNPSLPTFTDPLSIPGGSTVVCGDTVKDLQEMNLDVEAYNRYLARPIACQGTDFQKVEFTKTAMNYQLNIFDIFSKLVKGVLNLAFGWKGEVKNSKLYDLGCDQTSPGSQCEKIADTNTWRDHLVGYDPIQTETNIRLLNESKTNQQLAQNLQEVNYFYENSSAYDKLKPPDALDLNKKWRSTEIVDREKILAHILSGYKKSIIKKFGQLEPAHDYSCGYLSDKGVAALPKSENHDVAQTDPNVLAESTGSDDGLGSVSRPLYGIEIICTNPELKSPGVTDAEKDQICTDVMGSDYASGSISANSILGKKFTQINPLLLTLKTPSQTCIYEKTTGCGALYYCPIVRIEEYFGTLCQQNADAYNELGCKSIAIQNNAALDASRKMADLLSIPEDLERERTFEFSSKLSDQAIGGTYASEWVASNFGGTNNASYKITSSNQSNNNVRGVTSDQGDVLADSDINIPSGETTVTINGNQDIKYNLFIPKEVLENNYNLTNLMGMRFLPPEITQTLTTPTGASGVMPVQFGVENGIDVTLDNIGYNGNVKVEDPKAYFPVLGGSLLVSDPENGAFQCMLRPYCDPAEHSWCKPCKIGDMETGEYIRKLAKVQELEQLARAPWNKLLSIKESLQNEDLSNK